VCSQSPALNHHLSHSRISEGPYGQTVPPNSEQMPRNAGPNRWLTDAVPPRRIELLHSPISTYLDDRTDSHLPRRLAAQSTIPRSTPNLAPRPGAGTSMLLSGNSSLAALTSAGSASSSPSVSSAMGERALGPSRVLEFDGHGALQVPPLRHPPVFECPFGFLSCLLTFTIFSDWFAHSLRHFRGINPPNANKCCYCDQKFQENDGKASWKARMEHIALHYQLGHRLAHARPDFELYRYLWSNRLLDNASYKSLVGDNNSRSPPTSPNPAAPSASNENVYTVTNNPRRRHRR